VFWYPNGIGIPLRIEIDFRGHVEPLRKGMTFYTAEFYSRVISDIEVHGISQQAKTKE